MCEAEGPHILRATVLWLDSCPFSGSSGVFAAMTIDIVRRPTSRARLSSIAEGQFGDMVKAVVDVQRHVLAIGGELHADEEAALLEDGSAQQHLWGINLYPAERGDAWIEFDSLINVRPSQGNRSRQVEHEAIRTAIRQIVASLVED